MNYSGAVKTTIYGLYMRIFNQPFTVISWRLTGILLVSISLFVFGLQLRKILHPIGLAAFFFLFITDMTVLLTTRYDWGPTALSLSLRLFLLAFWIKGEFSTHIKPSNTFMISFLVGFSIFEKLSATVLLIPIFLMLFLNPIRRKISHLVAMIFGGILGAIPLIFANVLSFTQNGNLISFQFEHKVQTTPILTYLTDYLSLGAGQDVSGFILGRNNPIFNNSRGLISDPYLFIPPIYPV